MATCETEGVKKMTDVNGTPVETEPTTECVCFADEYGGGHSDYCPRHGMDYDIDGQEHRCPGNAPCAACADA